MRFKNLLLLILQINSLQPSSSKKNSKVYREASNQKKITSILVFTTMGGIITCMFSLLELSL
jgi:hypothetical protein